MPRDQMLERFNPLSRILTYDDFDGRACGWAQLNGNHNGDLDAVRPIYRDMRPPQISTVDFFDIGTHGPMTGRYALKIATRPRPGHMAVAIRRLTMQSLGPVQFEMYFAFKSEAQQGRRDGSSWDGNVDPSELDFGDFTVSNDVCRPDGRRAHCAYRYQNTDADGHLAQRWVHKTGLQATTKRQLADPSLAEPVDMHTVSEDDWQEIPGGHQQLCYNEVPTKVNWHYLRWLFDTDLWQGIELQVNDRVLDLRQLSVLSFPEPYHGLSNLLNLLVDVRTRRPVRNYLYVDSALISVGW
jgi:hypothetical protein